MSSLREHRFDEFALIDLYANFLVAGFRFDMSAEDVINFCDEYGRD